jgi:hypothetical protein
MNEQNKFMMKIEQKESVCSCPICGFPGLVYAKTIKQDPEWGIEKIRITKREYINIQCVQCGRKWEIAMNIESGTANYNITHTGFEEFTETKTVDSYYRVITSKYPVYDVSVSKIYPDNHKEKIESMYIDSNEIKFYGPEIQVGDKVEITYKYKYTENNPKELKPGVFAYESW